jgi:hypothetical protein
LYGLIRDQNYIIASILKLRRRRSLKLLLLSRRGEAAVTLLLLRRLDRSWALMPLDFTS